MTSRRFALPLLVTPMAFAPPRLVLAQAADLIDSQLLSLGNCRCTVFQKPVQ